MKTPIQSCALTLLLLFTSYVQAEQLGRLFFTPEQRKQFDYGRFQENGDNASDTLILNGIVQKDGGNRVAWINGVPQKIGKSDAHNPASVPLSIPNQTQSVTVKVGQKVEVTTLGDKGR